MVAENEVHTTAGSCGLGFQFTNQPEKSVRAPISGNTIVLTLSPARFSESDAAFNLGHVARHRTNRTPNRAFE